MEHATIAIDLAKTIFEIGISDRPGHVSEQYRLSRKQLPDFLANQPPTIILMEACSSSHYWARLFQRFGHDVVLEALMLLRWPKTIVFGHMGASHEMAGKRGF